ncbi:MAG TPA: hypothetical protein VHD36_09890 [Pirellulales bacterium]|nr:hypothetical protein [Pirellulales bacterium]
METSLHRELKLLYAGDAGQTEVRVGRYRIDAVAGDELVEIQHGRLGAISFKIAELLKSHDVRVVKPIVREKRIIKRRRRGGKIVSQRRSPKRGKLLDVFHDLVYFTKVFPHPRLSIETVLVDVEEERYPGHGRRRRYRRSDFQIEDQRLLAVGDSCLVREPTDLITLLDCKLPARFHTGHVATALDIPRWIAQRIAYSLRETGAVRAVGKERNAHVYELIPPRSAA